jgi:hypothetical protein
MNDCLPVYDSNRKLTIIHSFTNRILHTDGFLHVGHKLGSSQRVDHQMITTQIQQHLMGTAVESYTSRNLTFLHLPKDKEQGNSGEVEMEGAITL